MARQLSFDDSRVGRSEGDFFKPSGTKERPQRVAFVPGEALQSELQPSAELRRRAQTGDREAQERLEDIMGLHETLTATLKKRPPAAEVWTNETGQKVILYAKTESAKVFYVDNVGSVLFKDGIPDEVINQTNGIYTAYGIVLIEYDLDADGNVVLLPPDRQLDLPGGHKLDFRYTMKVWSLNDAKIRAWKEQTRNNPLIFTDFEVWTEQQGKSPRVKFSPCGPATWRRNEGVKRRVIAEARKVYAALGRLIAKDFEVDDILAMFPDVSRAQAGGRGRTTVASSAPPSALEDVDFVKLLGGEPPAEDESVLPALEQVLPDTPPWEAQGVGNEVADGLPGL